MARAHIGAERQTVRRPSPRPSPHPVGGSCSGCGAPLRKCLPIRTRGLDLCAVLGMALCGDELRQTTAAAAAPATALPNQIGHEPDAAPLVLPENAVPRGVDRPADDSK